METNLVAHWIKMNPRRVFAGAIAGLFAGGVMLLFAMILSSMAGEAFLAPARLSAIPLLGADAMTEGNFAGLVVGVVFHEVLCLVLGMLFGHFVYTHDRKSLLGLGATWGIFSWIFLNNLFFNAWREVYVSAQGSNGRMFFACVAFGLCLSVISVLDSKKTS